MSPRLQPFQTPSLGYPVRRLLRAADDRARRHDRERRAPRRSSRTSRFSQASLTWVVNAFLVTFGSLLLLAGRLGDLARPQRVFLAGLVTFTVASLLCGVASTEAELIGARLLQGVGAAAQASVILAIIVTEFPEAVERARAMSATCSSRSPAARSASSPAACSPRR